MQIASSLGPYSARLAEGPILEELRTSYKTVLSQDGIVFPTPDQEQADQLWGAYAARARGEYLLNADGSPVDLSTFDRDAVGDVLRAARPALANAEKLDSLVELGLLSKAGSLALSTTAELYGPESKEVTTVDNIMTMYKHFVQVGMSIEEWEQPWQELVRVGFAGEPLAFPLDADGIIYANSLLHVDQLTDVQRHFTYLHLFGHNLANRIDAILLDTVPQGQQRLAAAIAMFYRQSPEGCAQFVARAVERDALAPDVDWVDVMGRVTTTIRPQ
jgi:hypothetical protein